MPDFVEINANDIPKTTRKPSKKTKRSINPEAVPQWAQLLIRTVCEDYDLPIPPVRWRKSRKMRTYMNTDTGDMTTRITMYSSGTTYWNKEEGRHTHIAITEGSSIRDAHMVLLHELAHWSLHYTHHHSRTFWKRCWEMYKRYDVDLDYAFKREKDYKKAAVDEAPTDVRLRHERGDA